MAYGIEGRIRDFIENREHAEVGFERLALDVFAYQYERNEPYRRYSDRLGRPPQAVRHWRDIPAIPTSAFGAARLACFPKSRTVLIFVSSGTTSAGAHPSIHELESGALYDTSLLAHFHARVAPDHAPLRLVALAPSIEEAPASSLSYMLSKIADDLNRGPAFFIRGGALDFDAAAAALRSSKEPVLVFGTAFAFVHFFDRCRTSGERFRLPVGSRVVETGGFKGKSRVIARDELYLGFAEFFGVPRVFCISEYGMCELGAQWYDANLDDYFAGRPPRIDVKVGPHWARATIVDPVSAQPVSDGREGLVQVFDLTNLGSVSAILTSDVGRATGGGFELRGRFVGAPPKGCSMALDELLQEQT